MKTPQTCLLCGSLLAFSAAAQPVPQPDSGGAASTNTRPAAESIVKWINTLRDREGAERNAAVILLSEYPEAALPFLERALKNEANESRRWWFKAAIQECEENRLQPGEIRARPNHPQGLRPTDECKSGDGPFTVVERAGLPCWRTPGRVDRTWYYLYFKADDAFRQQVTGTLQIQVEYLDSGSGEIALEYDSTDPRPSANGAYRKHPQTIQRRNTGRWRKFWFQITDARFRGSQNGQSDFRFYNGGDEMLIRAVRVQQPGS